MTLYQWVSSIDVTFTRKLSHRRDLCRFASCIDRRKVSRICDLGEMQMRSNTRVVAFLLTFLFAFTVHRRKTYGPPARILIFQRVIKSLVINLSASFYYIYANTYCYRPTYKRAPSCLHTFCKSASKLM